jgi:predicted metal-dependent hydrolase
MYQEGSTLPYFGKNYPLKIVNHQKNKENKFEFINEEGFLVSLGINSKASKRRIKNLYEEWLIQKARPVFQEKVKHYSAQLGVEPSKIVVKNLKSRWGSATKGNVINLNVNLLKASEDVIDYIVLHELCHLMIEEHSHRFWNLMYRFMPDYQSKINWLKINESGLLHGHSRGD